MPMSVRAESPDTSTSMLHLLYYPRSSYVIMLRRGNVCVVYSRRTSSRSVRFCLKFPPPEDPFSAGSTPSRTAEQQSMTDRHPDHALGQAAPFCRRMPLAALVLCYSRRAHAKPRGCRGGQLGSGAAIPMSAFCEAWKKIE
eukprot:CAMPEP_0179004824 /NCGR_PEP_ID=MMETSP0795-20121207/13540_1 /TAXON_ID=88552 /ORGANISM="Amoebophrya sp., Strain Ameob2" /LENGTH=140 /DNA_ID=CAMNT_0020699171 /DNA_START=417 /DNA_END=839 /DNA_ORIENTATION=-